MLTLKTISQQRQFFCEGHYIIVAAIDQVISQLFIHLHLICGEDV